MPINVPNPSRGGLNLLNLGMGIATGNPTKIVGSLAPNSPLGKMANVYGAAQGALDAKNKVLGGDASSTPGSAEPNLGLTQNSDYQAIGNMASPYNPINKRIQGLLGGGNVGY